MYNYNIHRNKSDKIKTIFFFILQISDHLKEY